MRHLLQNLAASPTLAAGLPPPGLLHPAEQTELDGMRVVKRRRDWLLGRWTAKQLVQHYLLDTTGVRHPLPVIVIAADPDGAPYAELHPPASSLRLALSLSLSHSHDRALCALSDEAGTSVGADIEHIASLPADFAAQICTAAEADWVRAVAHERRDALLTALWCVKEATWKALRPGRFVDPRQLECQLAFEPGGDDWATFCAEMGGRSAGGWWNAEGDFVLALAQHRESI